MKTIYDEVLDILVESLTDPIDEHDEYHALNYIQMNKISKAIKKAQKQEKLLNQIKEIIDRPHTYITSMLEESQRYYEIEKQIKENRKNGK